MTETEQVHVFQWYYPDDAPADPAIAEGFAALLDPRDPRSRCRQLSVCAYCYATNRDERTHHQWGEAIPTFNGDQEYRCRRCGTTKLAPSPFNNQPGAVPGQDFAPGGGPITPTNGCP
jgi:ribosomal protein L40E